MKRKRLEINDLKDKKLKKLLKRFEKTTINLKDKEWDMSEGYIKPHHDIELDEDAKLKAIHSLINYLNEKDNEFCKMRDELIIKG